MGRRAPSVVTIVVAAIVAGCGLLPAPSPVLVLPSGDGFRELPVVLEDPDGLVASVAAGPLDPKFGSPSVTRTGSDTADVTWVGGACDSRVRLTIRSGNREIRVGLSTDQAGLGCSAVGIGRGLTITFRQPILDRDVVMGP